MKITRYPQSCFLIETQNKTILIDPGTINFNELFLEDWKQANIILITHKHSDHCNIDALMKLEAPIYTTNEVAKAYPELSPNIVKQGDIINIDNIRIEVTKAVHGFLPILKGGKEINEPIGFMIKAEKTLYHTGDTICFPNDYTCDILFVPVCNHGLVMGPFEAALFAKETQASLVIPMHYDNPRYPINLDTVEKNFKEQGLNYRILNIQEPTDI
ncbi:MBL fold metallo-hydrolase [Candidatus Woesearchaeota archaeon]|nr:MBL fold metallo-hydrolase [Candidatus Woesearchaeota archaeon]